MKRALSAFAAVVLAACFALPVHAVSLPVPQPVHVKTVEAVKHWKGWRGNRNWRNGHHWNGYARRPCRYYGSCYRPGYYGYRNYYPRYYQPYYRGYYPRYYRPYYPGYYPRSGVSIFLSF